MSNEVESDQLHRYQQARWNREKGKRRVRRKPGDEALDLAEYWQPSDRRSKPRHIVPQPVFKENDLRPPQRRTALLRIFLAV